jgi:hypothetical protein
MQEVFVSTGFEFGFLFCMRTENAIDPEAFRPFFEGLPVDPNIKGNYRLRRLSRFRITEDGFVKMPHGYLFQSKEYNPLVGDIKREFAELDGILVELDMFRALIQTFRDFCALRPGAEVGVHQIRTTCSPEISGNPAPEGIHRDGTDFVGIYSINRTNIQGGKTQLYTRKSDDPVFDKILHPGEFVLINDRRFFHYTTPVCPEGEGEGTRDVFVLTCPSLMSDY